MKKWHKKREEIPKVREIDIIYLLLCTQREKKRENKRKWPQVSVPQSLFLPIHTHSPTGPGLQHINNQLTSQEAIVGRPILKLFIGNFFNVKLFHTSNTPRWGKLFKSVRRMTTVSKLNWLNDGAQWVKWLPENKAKYVGVMRRNPATRETYGEVLCERYRKNLH